MLLSQQILTDVVIVLMSYEVRSHQAHKGDIGCLRVGGKLNYYSLKLQAMIPVTELSP
jgi:hypothetical protein